MMGKISGCLQHLQIPVLPSTIDQCYSFLLCFNTLSHGSRPFFSITLQPQMDGWINKPFHTFKPETTPSCLFTRRKWYNDEPNLCVSESLYFMLSVKNIWVLSWSADMSRYFWTNIKVLLLPTVLIYTPFIIIIFFFSPLSTQVLFP